jgi:DNA-binding transcriptional LysR family regulator
MDTVESMRLFTRIVERRSFTAAAEDFGLSQSGVTKAIKQLEERLGAQLLQRTTRRVRPTLDGEAYYRQCVDILGAIAEAEAGLSGAKPQGLLHIDVHGTLARYFMLPGLPAFLAEYPGIRLRIDEGGRLVDLVREGVDLMLRAGHPADSPMIGRRIALLESGTFASPDYLARHGRPTSPDDLAGHQMIGFISTATDEPVSLQFRSGDKLRSVMLPSVVTISNPETNVACARLGLGLFQVPHYRVAADLQAGSLVEILPRYPAPQMPVYVLYPKSRQLSARVRVFIDWLAREFASRSPKSSGEAFVSGA